VDSRGIESEVVKAQLVDQQLRFQEMRKTFFGTISHSTLCPDCQGEGNIPLKPCNVCKGEGRIQVDEEIEIVFGGRLY